jgi:hypothetical protein
MRSDWRRALDVYVAGRSRVLDADEKRRLAAAAPHARAGERRTGGTRPAATPTRVVVPDRLEFFRNAGTWRDRLPGSGGRDATSGD